VPQLILIKKCLFYRAENSIFKGESKRKLEASSSSTSHLTYLFRGTDYADIA